MPIYLYLKEKMRSNAKLHVEFFQGLHIHYNAIYKKGKKIFFFLEKSNRKINVDLQI